MEFAPGHYIKIIDSQASWVITVDEVATLSSTVKSVHYGVHDDDGSVTARTLFGPESEDCLSMVRLLQQRKPSYLILKSEKEPEKELFREYMALKISQPPTELIVE